MFTERQRCDPEKPFASFKHSTGRARVDQIFSLMDFPLPPSVFPPSQSDAEDNYATHLMKIGTTALRLMRLNVYRETGI